MADEPTILVKKKDGTSVRLPLSSLGQAQHGEAQTDSVDSIAKDTEQVQGEQSISQPTQKSAQQVQESGLVPPSVQESAEKLIPKESTTPSPQEGAHSLPVAQTPHELASATPVDHYFEHVSKAHAWSAEDHVSPLEESLPGNGAPAATPVMPVSRYDDVQKVVQALPFSIPASLHSRLHSLIQSRVKDVRSDSQVREYATTPQEDGGLGCDVDQAALLIDTIHQVLAVKKEVTIPAPAPSAYVATVSTARKKEHLPEASVQEPSRPIATPTRTLSDIQPPASRASTMGPVDEMASMTVVDFRRLSKDPHRAIEMLQEKMHTMRKESYLEYVQMARAWGRSPLYLAYLAVLDAALMPGQTLSGVLAGSDMTAEDIAALSGFSERIRAM